MSSMQAQWNDLCARLGVKPKQFGTLLAVMVVSVGGLGVKAMVGTRSASASATSVPAAPANTNAAVAAPSAPAPAIRPDAGPGTSAATTPGVRRVIECRLEQVPARDPFRAWGMPEPVAAPVAAPVTDAAPGLLPGLPLRAVLRGELAVFGDQTVRPGESVSLPDGTFARVRSIGDRSAAVEWNGHTIDVMVGAGNGAGSAKAPTAGGFK